MPICDRCKCEMRPPVEYGGYRVTMDGKGRIVIPAEQRERFNGLAFVSVRPGVLTITPAPCAGFQAVTLRATGRSTRISIPAALRWDLGFVRGEKLRVTSFAGGLTVRKRER